MAPPPRRARSLALAALLVLGVVILAPRARAADDSTDGLDLFERKIRPLLVDQCYRCHSATAEKVKGGLKLDTRAALQKGGDSGPVLTPGDPDHSRLIQAVRWSDPDLQMPPKQKLTDEQINDLVTWVKLGAPAPRGGATGIATTAPAKSIDPKSKDWWAFKPVQNPPPPTVQNAAWTRDPIDAFILAKLEEKKLAPAAPADKRTLIRRATFDLTGLPPTDKDVADFLADTSPAAFAKVVDRLLASPAYGQKWARHWLDVVRYTDAFDSRGAGGMADVPEAWRYRDWVVNALNADLPYNHFVTQQIAGDLLPGRKPDELNVDGLIATGMYVIGNWGNGDADKEKMLTDIVDDQIDVTGRAFLGLTLACARCHDHKFDPVPTEDYYGLAGMFFSSHILPEPGAKTAGSTVLRVPLAPKPEVERLKQRDSRVTELTLKIRELAAGHRLKLAVDSIKLLDKYLAGAWECRGKGVVPIAKYALAHDLDTDVLKHWVEYLAPEIAPETVRRPLTRPNNRIQGIDKLNGLNLPEGRGDTPNVVYNESDDTIKFLTITLPARSLSLHPGKDTAVAAAWKSSVTGPVKITGKLADADDKCGNGVAWRLELLTRTSPPRVLSSGTLENGASQPIPTINSLDVRNGDTLQLVIDPRGDYSCDSTIVELSIDAGDLGDWQLPRDVLKRHAQGWQFAEVASKSTKVAAGGSALAAFLSFMADAKSTPADRTLAATTVRDKLLELHQMAEQVRARGRDPLNPAYLTGPDADLYRTLMTPGSPFWGEMRDDNRDIPLEARQQLADMRYELQRLEKQPMPSFSYAHGIQEGGTPDSPYAEMGDVRVHLRGRYDKLGDLVPRHLPRVLVPESEQPTIGPKESGRLELARWVASPANPLTARVMANRLWQWHFGQGIVRTPGNFGKLGVPPTHPELLDHLATRFVQSGWSLKAMHRAIMLSATYQQSTVPNPDTLKADPTNQLVGHMNRRRLEAEELRDALLATTDALDLAQRGPATTDLNASRRTLYLMTNRSDRGNYRNLFDAPDPTTISEGRSDSVVAPQALFLLNHPFASARAEALAKLVTDQKDADDKSKIESLYRRLFARPPTDRELQIGLTLIPNGWPQYCQILLCTNEFIYVD